MEEVLEFIDIIQISSSQMFDLIINLLDVNMIESGKINVELETVDILPTLQKLVNTYTKPMLAKNITWHFQALDTEYIIVTDQNIIRQILDNIISNAVKYSPYGKNIFIRIEKNGVLYVQKIVVR